MRWLLTSLVLLLVIGGCGKDLRAPGAALQQRALASINGSFPAPNVVVLREAWVGTHGLSFGLVCGRIEASPLLQPARSTLRFIYDDHSRFGQVEFHEMVVADTLTGTALIAQNRVLFDNLWSTQCAAVDPERPWYSDLVG